MYYNSSIYLDYVRNKIHKSLFVTDKLIYDNVL